MGGKPSKKKYKSGKPTHETTHRVHYLDNELRQPQYHQSQHYENVLYYGTPCSWSSRLRENHIPFNQTWHNNPCYQDDVRLQTRSTLEQPTYAIFNRVERENHETRPKHPTTYRNGGSSWNYSAKPTAKYNRLLAERSSLKTDIEILEARLTTQTTETNRCNQELKELKNVFRRLQARLNTVTAERDTYLQDIEKANMVITQVKAEANKNEIKRQQEILELQQETDDLKTRLSAVFGAKLQDNNPNIANLSDKNRPTILAERYSELYDNEWTNCFDVISKRPAGTEKETIQLLLKVCVTINEQCKETATQDLEELTRAIETFSSEQTVLVVKNLKESRKKRYQHDIKRIEKKLETSMATVFKTEVDESHVKEYWTKCLEICWLMAIQDPPVSMDTRTDRQGEVLDAATYRPYTKGGQYIEYIVWPSLYLTEEGSVLYKGVAQGTNER